MIAELYSIQDLILIPTLGRTEAGFHLAGEPVEVLKKPALEDLVLALTRVEQRGNPLVPTPPRNAFPKPVVLRYARVRTWTEFERRARAWGLRWSPEGITITPSYRAPEGGYLDDPSNQYVASGPEARAKAAEAILRLVAISDATAQ